MRGCFGYLCHLVFEEYEEVIVPVGSAG
eukprot:COSAG05_NODE_11360_length_517_cov_0.758373_1_plen_27_part_10